MSNQAKARVSVDFNCRDNDNNVVINTGIPDHEHLNRELVDGMLVVLFDETLEVGARVKWNKDFGMWVGIPDWKTSHDLV